MRKIRFRGKSKLNGKWHYGSYIRDNNQNDYCQIVCENVDIGDIINNQMVRVISESVGQFTGLLDKNGKEIYEGDIIECLGSNGKPIRHHVKYNDERGGYSQYLFIGEWVTIEPYDGGLLWQQYITEHGKYVIGNIHDSQELLKT